MGLLAVVRKLKACESAHDGIGQREREVRGFDSDDRMTGSSPPQDTSTALIASAAAIMVPARLRTDIAFLLTIGVRRPSSGCPPQASEVRRSIGLRAV